MIDIEKSYRRSLISLLEPHFDCIEECNLKWLVAPEIVRADVVAISREGSEPWVFAFEVKKPTGKWELKNWLAAFAQAGIYPNCCIRDHRAERVDGRLINAAFLYPAPDITPWAEGSSQGNRFYRKDDREGIRGAQLLAQHFRTGMVRIEPQNGRCSLVLGTDRVWDNHEAFGSKSHSILSARKIGASKRRI
jgi:hypothetical protein